MHFSNSGMDRPKSGRRLAAVAATFLYLLPNLALADHESEVEEIVIVARQSGASLTESIATVERTPGAATVIDFDTLRSDATITFKDVLMNSPGVYAQSRYGGGETRISIRGSGISQTYNSRGVRLLRDGLPLNEADGNLRPQLLEPLTMSHVEILRGANAMEYGVSTLGGAVSMSSLTGSGPHSRIARLEFGQDNYFRPQLVYGGLIGDRADYLVSYSGIYTDGFRENSREASSRAYANIGVDHGSRVSSRFHLYFQDNNLELPGSLSKQQVKDDPTQANSFFASRHNQRNFKMYRGAYQFGWEIDDTRTLKAGLSYQGLEMYHPIASNIMESWQNDVVLTLRFEHEDPHPEGSERWYRRFLAGANIAWGNNDGDRHRNTASYSNPGHHKGVKNRERDLEAFTSEFWLEDRFALGEQWEVVVSGMLSYAIRDSEQTTFDDPNPPVDFDIDEDYLGLSPRLGVVWRPREDTQIFSNVSRSYEPPTNGQFSDTSTGRPLKAQKATTLEVGARGSLEDLPQIQWEAAFYYSFVEDEILRAEEPPNSGDFFTGNSNDTRHMGVELGIVGVVPLHVLTADDELSLRVIYNYNDYEFDGDDSWGNNRLPGIPEHYGNAELLYRIDGVYFGPTVEFASGWYVDYANSLEADAFGILGVKAGIHLEGGWHAFFEAKNLQKKNYASNSGITEVANENTRVFNPGRTRSFFAGFEYRW